MFSFIFILLFAFALETTEIKATESVESTLVLVSEDIKYLSDGSYIKTITYSSNAKSIYSLNNSKAGNVTAKTGITDVTRYDGDNNITWQYTLTGYFHVDYGVSCSCYYATYSQFSNSSSWTFSNGATSFSGNVAYGQGTFKYKLLFVTLQTVDIDVNVTCDEFGNIS